MNKKKIYTKRLELIQKCYPKYFNKTKKEIEKKLFYEILEQIKDIPEIHERLKSIKEDIDNSK